MVVVEAEVYVDFPIRTGCRGWLGDGVIESVAVSAKSVAAGAWRCRSREVGSSSTDISTKSKIGE